MSRDEGVQDVPVHEGPDPRAWPGRPDIWNPAEDLRQADAMLELLDGKVARDGMPPAFEEARMLLRAIAAGCATSLAEAILSAYKVPVPEEEPELPTEAVGGVRGNGNSPGNRDHLR